MSNKMITLQEPVPAFESLSSTISNLTWNWGLGNFFIQNIPNSFSTGHGYAKKLADAFALQLEATNKLNTDAPLYSLEIGAGTGVLSKHFLDKLDEFYPNIYNRITHYVTDLSKKNLNGIKNSKILQSHNSKYKTTVLDATKPISLPVKLDFVIMVNLLDSLPTRHFHKDKKGFNEVLIKSKIPIDTYIIDSTKKIPQILTAVDIKSLVDKKNHSKKDQNTILNLSTQLTPIINEEHYLQPLHERNYDKEEYRFYTTILNNLKMKNGDYINLSYYHHLLFKELYASCKESPLIMLRDAGNTKGVSLEKENLTLNFNSAQFTPLNLQSIFEIAKQYKLYGKASSNTKIFSEVYATLFKKPSKYNEKITSIFSFDEEVAINIKWSKEIERYNKESFPEFFKKHGGKIPYKNSYFLTQFLAIHSIQQKNYELALSILNSSLIVYPCYLKLGYFKAFCYYHLNEEKKCDEEIQYILAQCPHYLTALTLNYQRLIDQKKYKDAIAILLPLIPLQNKEEQITSYKSLFDLYSLLNMNQERKELILFFKRLKELEK